MEGLTDSIYRSVHHKFFSGVDAYYMPFISPTIHRCLTNREAREVPIADTVPFRAVPQLMTKVADDFLWAAQECKNRGYDEVNLNVGCPSGTVVAKKKGSGMLEDPENLDRFLDAIFASSPLPISLKTRLGLTDSREFPRILDIYNQYPIKELTVHPRVRKDFYKEPVREEWFRYAYENSKNPLCYNGNIMTRDQADSVSVQYSGVDAVMIGRALIADPGMLCGGTTAKALEGFLSELTEEYIREFGSARNAMFRLKEHWHCMLQRFDADDKLKKRLRKVTDLSEYRTITAELFCNTPLLSDYTPNW
jgi:tRNA-dihydrouridine synthase